MVTPTQKSKKISPQKIYTFSYEGRNTQGKKTKGEITATDLALARTELKRQGIIATKLKKKMKLSLPGQKKSVKPADISAIARQLATMMSAGVPLVQSFDIVAKGTDNESVRDLVLGVKAEIESGRSLSEALRSYPLYFDDLFCNLVAAGEASGSLETMLDRIATYKEKSESLKRKIKKALFYPTAVIVVALVVTSILLIYVVPQFQSMFKGFGADLPLFTRMVISLSNFVQEWWWIILAAIITFLSVFSYYYRRKKFIRDGVDKLMLRIPIIGKILHKASIARFARTLGITFAAGVPLVEALTSVAGATGNVVYSDAVMRIREEVSTGSQIQTAMRNTGVFPNLPIQMIGIGEESGSLDKMLSKVADIYEEEVDTAVDGLSTLLEPLIMAVLGILVGGLVVAMYLPIFKLGSVV